MTKGLSLYNIAKVAMLYLDYKVSQKQSTMFSARARRPGKYYRPTQADKQSTDCIVQKTIIPTDQKHIAICETLLSTERRDVQALERHQQLLEELLFLTQTAPNIDMADTVLKLRDLRRRLLSIERAIAYTLEEITKKKTQITKTVINIQVTYREMHSQWVVLTAKCSQWEESFGEGTRERSRKVVFPEDYCQEGDSQCSSGSYYRQMKRMSSPFYVAIPPPNYSSSEHPSLPPQVLSWFDQQDLTRQ